MAYRPRGTLARTLFDKIHNDQYLEGYDMKLVSLSRLPISPHPQPTSQSIAFWISPSQWYTLSKSLPEKYQSKFLSLEKPDDITLNWLEQAKQLSGNLWLQLWHLAARLFLGFFMTQTSINGYETTTVFNFFPFNFLNYFFGISRLLKRGSMFILSEEQFKNLLQAGGFNVDSRNENEIRILDIGAGDGEVTMRLAKSIIHMNYNIFLKVFATEYSWTMRDRLQEKQFM